MSNSPEQSQPYNDEIDLADLVRALWQGKWLVIGVTLATLALGIAYLLLAPKNYTASLNISALPAAQSDVYVELNATKLMPIDEQVLLTLFVEDLQTQSRNALGLSLASATPTQWLLSFPTQTPGQLNQTVVDALELTHKNVNQQLVRKFSRRSDELVRNNVLAIELLDLEQQQKVALFKANQKKQVAILDEQAQIARYLNIDKGTYTSLTELHASKTYNEGYVALEKEIELIKSRNVETFIPDTVRIETLKSELLSNKKVEKAEVLLANTPIGTDQFAAVSYNLDSIAYKNNTKTSLILALSIVLGGMLGIFVLLIRNTIINKD